MVYEQSEIADRTWVRNNLRSVTFLGSRLKVLYTVNSGYLGSMFSVGIN
jgi:hypothetical protein